MIWIGLAGGLVLLLGGGEALVKGGVSVASRLGVSPLLVGLILVGFGTSTPELVASLEAALIGAPGIAVGNIVGSNIANVLLILGISAAILPMATTREAFRRDGTVLVGASLALLAAVLGGTLGRWTGSAFLLMLAAYTIYTYRTERRTKDAAAAMHAAEAADVAPRHVSLAAGLALSLGGIAAVIIGASLLVEAALEIAGRLGLSEAVIGLTLVAVGTSLPELATAAMAALRRHGDVAFGNIVGSNIANVLLILGISAAILPMATTREAFRRDGAVLVGASLALLAAVLGGTLGRWTGSAFLLMLAAYTIYTYRTERRTKDAAAAMHAAEAADVAPRHVSLAAGLALSLGGIAAVIIGASLLVEAALEIAGRLGLSEAVIGLTLVAVGTSLPELATSAMAALRRHGDVAFGNIVGSNIFNILGIGGATALVSPIAVPAEIIRLDIWVMLAATLLLVAFATTGLRVTRMEGAVFVIAYAAYLLVQFSPDIRRSLGLM